MDAKNRTRVKLYDFLEKNCLVQKGSEFTHTSIYDPMASYYISPDKTETFFKLYNEAVLKGADMYMTEKHRDIGPVVVDLDFRFPYNDGDEVVRKYKDEDIIKIVKLYASVLSEFVEDQNTFNLYVMEKPSPVLFKGLIKDGVHIVIPDVVTRPVFQHMIRERLLEPIQEALKDLGLSNPITDVVDEAVIERNNWQMYGSKKPHLEKYVVTQIYEFNKTSGDITTQNVTINDPEHVEILSIRNKYRESKIKFEKNEDLKKYEALIESRKMRAHFKNSILSKTRNTQKNKIESEEEFNRISELIDLLNGTRADNYNDWIRVGWCLRNIDFRLLNKWISFSRKSRKFIAGECEKQWDYMRQDGACLGKGTLHLWAKQDNPDRYSELVQEDLRRLVNLAKSGTEYDVALVIQKMYDHNFIYDSRNKIWYVFNNHRWHLSDEGLALKKKLPTEVADAFRTSAAFFQARAARPDTSADDKERLDEVVKKLQEVISKLKRAAFQSSVMTEAAMLFQVDKIDEKFDTNTHLIGFENGVYDLDALEFREGRPEDYITMSTNINYNPYDETNPFISEIKGFFSQVLRIEAVREYVFGLFASFLHGDIREERFHVWTGVGCHAKGAKIMMFDGSIKNVEDIIIGDKLMGDDSTERNVQELFRGHSDMYKIQPIKGNPFVVNGEHILSLKATNMISMRYRKDREGHKAWAVRWKEFDDDKVVLNKSKHFEDKDAAHNFMENIKNDKKTIKHGDVIDVSVNKYLENIGRIGKRDMYLYKCPTEFPSRDVPVNPYIFGYWLGDGHSNHSSITTEDKEVADYIHQELDGKCDVHISQEGNAKTYSICKKENDEDFCCYAELRKLGVINNKRIPDLFKNNSKEIRMEVLAGLMDSDGHHQKAANEFEITLKNELLMDDVISLARSLGFACYKYQKTGTWTHNGVKKSGIYWRTYIVGEGLESIPTKLPRKLATKRIKNKNVSMIGFKIEKVEDDDFYGFELDGNHRYMMDDYIVTHNSNGKSKALELYQKSFGEYCCTLPIALLTQKRGASSSASPELARARSKRFACLQEPGENERLNIGLMKEMTGGDKLYARGLYKEGGEFKPQFKMVLTCNHLPLVPSDDGGTWRRIRVVRFESRFCDNPEPQKPNEFPIDTNLATKFDDWKEPFMSLLVEYYKKIVTQKMKEPEEVLECTREYQRRNDIIMDFLDSSVEKHDNGFLSVTDAFVEFKTWLKEEGVVNQTMRKSDFQNYIEKKYGKAVKKKLLKGWLGFRLKSSIAEYNGQDDYD